MVLFIKQPLSYSILNRFHDNIRDALWENVFERVLQLLPLNFLGDSTLELMFTSLIQKATLCLIHLHGFHLLLLLSLLLFIETTSFILTNLIERSIP